MPCFRSVVVLQRLSVAAVLRQCFSWWRDMLQAEVVSCHALEEWSSCRGSAFQRCRVSALVGGMTRFRSVVALLKLSVASSTMHL